MIKPSTNRIIMKTSDYLREKNFYQIEAWEDGLSLWEAVFLPDGGNLKITARVSVRESGSKRISLRAHDMKAKDGRFFTIYDVGMRSIQEEFNMRSGGVWNVLREFLDAMGCELRGRMLNRNGDLDGGFELMELST